MIPKNRFRVRFASVHVEPCREPSYLPAHMETCRESDFVSFFDWFLLDFARFSNTVAPFSGSKRVQNVPHEPQAALRTFAMVYTAQNEGKHKILPKIRILIDFGRDR